MSTAALKPLDTTRPLVDCPVCDSPRCTPYLEGRGYTIVECSNCRLRYINPQPSESELQKFYADFDLENTWRGDGEEGFDRAMCKIVRRYQPGGSILDIGSSRGNFLIAMKQAGFSVYGVEPSPKNSEFARSANGIPSYTGTVEEFLSAPTRTGFNAISVLNVLEHVRHPKFVLRSLRNLLEDRGILILGVPDARLHAFLGQSRKALGFSDPFWMNTQKHPLVGFDPPPHLCSFEPRTIKLLAESCGFQTLRVGNAPIMVNRDSWKNLAKAVTYAGAQALYFASFGKLLLGYSTIWVGRKN
jgi:2-polyprenyl-3-methyl-5-hydroxy-6-metoxy-1,4-benzoquinol methylase